MAFAASSHFKFLFLDTFALAACALILGPPSRPAPCCDFVPLARAVFPCFRTGRPHFSRTIARNLPPSSGAIFSFVYHLHPTTPLLQAFAHVLSKLGFGTRATAPTIALYCAPLLPFGLRFPECQTRGDIANCAKRRHGRKTPSAVGPRLLVCAKCSDHHACVVYLLQPQTGSSRHFADGPLTPDCQT